MQQSFGSIRFQQPAVAMHGIARIVVMGLRLLLGMLALSWAAGQLGWAGWLLAGPPGWLVPESIASPRELALWLIVNGFAGCLTAAILFGGGARRWRLTCLVSLIGWTAWPVRVLLERWWLLGTLAFEPQGSSLGVPWPVREGWFVLLVVSALGILVARHREREPAR